MKFLPRRKTCAPSCTCVLIAWASLMAGGAGAAQTPPPLPAAVAAKVTRAEDPMLTRVFPSIVRIEVIRLRPSDGRVLWLVDDAAASGLARY